MDRDDDVNGAKYELEKLMKKGSFKPEGEEEASDDFEAEPLEEPTAEEPSEEPEA